MAVSERKHIKRFAHILDTQVDFFTAYDYPSSYPENVQCHSRSHPLQAISSILELYEEKTNLGNNP